MKLNKSIDHTNLGPFTPLEDIKTLCEEAIEYGFFAVCVSPYHTSFCHEFLKHSDVKISTVIGFPYGYDSIESKASNMTAIHLLVDEFDIVVNLQAVINNDWRHIEGEIAQLTHLAHQYNTIVKWIVESGNISESQLERLCAICNKANVDFMKTSTGMLGAGASVEAITFMRAHLDDDIQLKASGGIRDRNTALKMVKAGATRIGASKGIEIVRLEA